MVITKALAIDVREREGVHAGRPFNSTERERES